MCGIFGRIGVKSEPLNKMKLNVLGVTNDVRGGDSCGLFIDGKVEYGHDKTKYYQQFMYKSKLLEETKYAKLVLGHDRKASIGEISLETAQPVCLYDDKGNIEYVLIHNGTIYNYEELAKKYIPHIDIKGLTDSQVMARIFYWSGYEALNEYNGAAVFVIADYRDKPKNCPTVYMYKGASKNTEYSKEITTERPLFLTISSKEVWFSSISDMLDAVSYPDSCLTLYHNMLIEVEYDKEINLVTAMDVDRSKCIQTKKYTYYNNKNRSNERNYNHGSYGDENYNNYYGNNYYKNEKGTYVKGPKKILKDPEWIIDSDYSVVNRITLSPDGLYRRGKELVHGIYSLSRFGYGHISTGQHYTPGTYCFFMGRLLPSVEVFNMLMDVSSFADTSPANFEDEFPQVLDKYSYIPSIMITADEKDIEAYEVRDFDDIVPFSGTIKPIFSSNFKHFEFIDSLHIGTETAATMEDNISAFIDFTKEWEKVTLDIEEYTIKEFILSTRKKENKKKETSNINN